MRIKTINDPTEINDELMTQLVDLGLSCFESSMAYSKEVFVRQLTDKNTLIVLLNEQQVQGCCLYVTPPNTQTIKINYLCVHPTFQKKGLGLLLLNHTLSTIDINKPYQMHLECQPYHENYYKKLGFKTLGLHQDMGCYHIERSDGTIVELPSVRMYTSALKPYAAKTENLQEPSNRPHAQQDTQHQLEHLIRFVDYTRHSTSFWYKRFYHSARKEKAFEAIYKQLIYLRKPKNIPVTNAMLLNCLRAVLANALVVRGHCSSKHTQTKSAKKALSLLNNNACFAFFNQSIRQATQTNDLNTKLSYHQLRLYSKHTQPVKSDSLSEYPYTHFASP